MTLHCKPWSAFKPAVCAVCGRPKWHTIHSFWGAPAPDDSPPRAHDFVPGGAS